MNLQRLRTFVAVVEAGSINAAARALSYTPPAVAQQLATLEREVGCELLIRGARGVIPTPAGQVLLLRAGELLASADQMLRDVRETSSHSRHLTVGSFPSFSNAAIPNVFSRFRTIFPDVELILHDFEPPDGLNEIVAGRLDILITVFSPGTPVAPMVAVENLFDDPYRLIASTQTERADFIALETYADASWISGKPDMTNRVALESAAASLGFKPRVVYETNDFQAAIGLAVRGFGVTIVPQLVMTDYPDVRTSAPQVLGRPLVRTVVVAYRRPLRSRLLTSFISELRAATQHSTAP